MNKHIGEALLAGSLFITASAGPVEAKSSSAPTTVNNHVDKKGVKRVAQDNTWKLLSVTGIGRTDAVDGTTTDCCHEVSFYRLDFQLGATAVSCIAQSEGDEGFSNSPVIDPTMCFINGDISKPLLPRNTTPR